MNIINNNCLSNKINHDLRELAAVCKNIDEIEPKIYWNILKIKRPIDGNYFYYNNNKKLIGYLSFFLFEENSVHISALVHPEHRRQGIFLRLLHLAVIQIEKLGIKKIIFSFPKQNEAARNTLKFLSGQVLYDEYQMVRAGSFCEKIENTRNGSIKKANLPDLQFIAEMDAICFNTNYTVILDRFQETIDDPDREIWLLHLENQIIGKCHLQFDENGVYIHNFCILPTHQNLGFGTILLKLIINQLIKDNHDYFYLDLIAEHISALHIYQNCHFTIMHTDEYQVVLI